MMASVQVLTLNKVEQHDSKQHDNTALYTASIPLRYVSLQLSGTKITTLHDLL